MTTSQEIRKCGFRARFLKPLSRAMAKKDVRYYLNGIHIQPNPVGEGVIITATNGYFLLTILDTKGWTNGEHICNVTTTMVAAAGKACRDKDSKIAESEPVVSFCEDGAYVYGGLYDNQDAAHGAMQHGLFLAEYSKPIDGNYPDFQRVFKQAESKGKLEPTINPDHMNFNSDYLKEAGVIFAEISSTKHQATRILGSSDIGLVLSLDDQLEGDYDARMIIMPMRSSEPLKVKPISPAWVDALESRDDKKKAAA